MTAPVTPSTGPRPMLRHPRLFVVVMVTLIMVAWNASFWVLRWKNSDDGPLYEYQGTSGPFSVRDEQGALAAGDPISSTKPGSVVGWTTSLCVHPGVEGLGVTEVVKVSPGDDEVVTRIEVPIPKDSRCGPRLIARLMPADAPPGYYEIRRQLVLSVNGRPRPAVDLPTLHIRVEKP